MAHPITRSENFTYNILAKQLEPKPDEKMVFNTVLRAYDGDFWQEGQGSLLPPAVGTTASRLTDIMEKRFVYRNVIKECAERVSRAFFGKSPNWRIKIDGRSGTEKPTSEDDEIEKALGEFWTSQDVATVMAKALESRLVGGRGGIRIYIPAKYKSESQTSSNAGPNIEDRPIDPEKSGTQKPVPEISRFSGLMSAINAIRIEYIPPSQGRLMQDNGELFSIVKYAIVKNFETNELENVIEFSFVDNDNATFIGLLEERSGVSSIDSAALSSPLQLGGYTTYNEFIGEPYITSALYKNNQLLNLALTCAGFSLVDNGFGEVFFTNVELETETVIGPDGDPVAVPKKMVRGGGAIQSLVGISQRNDEGTESIMTPGVHFKEPTQITVFKDGKDLAYEACLEEAGQLFALISGDATASGESRIQAMADFVLKITKYKTEVDKMGTWLMTAALRFASALSLGSDLSNYSIVFDSKIFAGTVSSDERRIIGEMLKDGRISMETARVLSGIDDPRLEGEIVESEREISIFDAPISAVEEKLSAALQMNGILPQSAILKFLGFTDSEISAYKQEIADDQAVVLENFRAVTEGDGAGDGAGDGSGATAAA